MRFWEWRVGDYFQNSAHLVIDILLSETFENKNIIVIFKRMRCIKKSFWSTIHKKWINVHNLHILRSTVTQSADQSDTLKSARFISTLQSISSTIYPLSIKIHQKNGRKYNKKLLACSWPEARVLTSSDS